MDTVQRVKLQKYREKIVQDLQVENVLDALISNEILTNDDVQRIKQEKTERDKARHLLDILPKKGPKSFEVFISVLKKDYSWLSELLEAQTPHTTQIEENSFLDAKFIGGVPEAPPHYVERVKKVQQIRSSLRELQRTKYVVLHGMTGCGKSCLAAAALNDKDLLMGTFKGTVYWKSVGKSEPDDVLCHMTELLEQLSHHSAIQEEGLPPATTVESARNSLRRYFTNKALREGLLILDDVTSKELIEAFDIGCKILVITKDLFVMDAVKGRYDSIEISEGFTEEESLLLLSKCVDLKISQLPEQAKKIHRACKGVPMVIALIGAQLEQKKQDAQRNLQRWNDYLNKLTKKDYKNINRKFSRQSALFAPVELCVEDLPKNMKQYYFDFAIFVEDVNIKPEVLETLWSLNKYEVEDILTEFVNKSLAVCKWNESLNNYVYGIHDLLLSYLRDQLNEEEKQSLHRKLLNRYSAVCNGNFANLPNDNYIFSYLGYHLREAGWTDRFPVLYLNLEFIGSKVRHTGPADLLVDYKKYRDYIISENEERKNELECLEHLIQRHGLDLHKYQRMDIIQCALMEPKNSSIYKKALTIAKDKPQTLYFNILMEQNGVSQHQTLSLKNEVYAACFTGKEKKILAANGNGVINMWDVDYARIVYTFHGHSGKVLKLHLNPDEIKFVSCSEDGTAKIWSLEETDCRNQDNEEFDELGCPLRTPSPRMRQSGWNNMFSADHNGDRSIQTFRGHEGHVLCATFSNQGDEVVSCSRDGNVKVWIVKTAAEQLNIKFPSKNCYANSCTFSEDDSLIIFGGNDNCVHICDVHSGEFVTTLRNSASVIAVCCVPDVDNKVIAVTEESIALWSWVYSSKSNGFTINQHNNNNNASQNLQITGATMKAIDCNRCTQYTSAAVSADGKYVIVAALDSSINVWDIHEHTVFRVFQDHSGSIWCLDTYFTNNHQLLLSGSDDKTIKLWRIEPNQIQNVEQRRQTFDAFWNKHSTDTTTPLLAATDSGNKIQGTEVILETSPQSVKVTVCRIAQGGKAVLIGCCDGVVKEYLVEQKTSSIIIRFNSSEAVHYLQVDEANDLIIAAGVHQSLKICRSDGSVVVCGSQTSKVIECFPFARGHKLLSCAENGSVKVFSVGTGDLLTVLIGRLENGKITAASLACKEDILVLCFAEGKVHFVYMEESLAEPFIHIKSIREVNIGNPLTCCRFSSNDQFVALGQENGTVLVWDVTENAEIGPLLFHKTAVQMLLFSPPVIQGVEPPLSSPPVILVSVGDHIAWWDISRLLVIASNRRQSSGRRRRRSGNREQQNRLSLKLLQNNTKDYLADEWLGKLGTKDQPELLACLRLMGRKAMHISSSADFSAFVTIDACGTVYFMKVLR